MVVGAHRQSTRKLYDVRWLAFVTSCRRKNRDPGVVDVPFLADYLLYLRNEKNLAGSTIGTYLASISSVWSRSSSTIVSRIPELTAILKSFRLGDNRRRFKPPAWDLNTVLQFLTSDTFEPLGSADLLRLTQKTVFLLAMATAARIGELHAIDVSHITFNECPTGQDHLALLWNFVVKNQSADQEGRIFHPPPLANIIRPHDREDLFLCPVLVWSALGRTASPFA